MTRPTKASVVVAGFSRGCHFYSDVLKICSWRPPAKVFPPIVFSLGCEINIEKRHSHSL